MSAIDYKPRQYWATLRKISRGSIGFYRGGNIRLLPGQTVARLVPATGKQPGDTAFTDTFNIGRTDAEMLAIFAPVQAVDTLTITKS